MPFAKNSKIDFCPYPNTFRNSSRSSARAAVSVTGAAARAGFEILITSGRNMAFQQNLAGQTIAVVVLSTNFWPTIRSRRYILRCAVANVSPGTFTFATFVRRRRS
jgi:hypothetical protein